MWSREPYSLIAKEVRDAWRSGGHPSSLFGRAIKELFRNKPIEGVYIVQYASADFEVSRCCGEVVGTWYYSGDEFKTTLMPDRIEQPSAIWTPTLVLSFHYSESESEFVICWFSGVRAGHGNKYKIIERHGYRSIEPYGGGWRS